MEPTNTTGREVVPAGTGRAVTLRRGDRVRVIDVEGGQVGDVFAFAADDGAEHLSASHTRTATSRLFPRVGESFVTNRRRPILAFVEDTSPGVHDMLIAACDAERYRAFGLEGHPSCADNLRGALELSGLGLTEVPQPVNIFMNIPVADDGALSWLPAPTRPGDAVVFEAVMDCVVVVSACPMDVNAINGHRPTQLAIEIESASPRGV
ncbi:hypothetical protein NIIDNTM18_22360 [Mycolicibacterium litorale]|uniref:DUF1989 domain-containing protein n=1 Tax=Mycolicibacterium litorale TaxID=758802 RepID=A0A6S6P9P5_9MYCO|nr:urea carboxylase-associated family protein [Mycolicibacterium litorale]BCI52958.1 hypothetical protein NIIDNTM18_22360 [Mycolicibacterium litorale]